MCRAGVEARVPVEASSSLGDSAPAVSVKGLVGQSCPTLCDPMDWVGHQAPLSMEFSRQEH